MECWKTTVTINPSRSSVIPTRAGPLRTHIAQREYTDSYWPALLDEYEKIFKSRGNWEWLYCESSRNLRWNIAWALGTSFVLRLYFTVHPSSRHTVTVTVLSTWGGGGGFATPLWSRVQCSGFPRALPDTATHRNTARHHLPRKVHASDSLSGIRPD